MLKQSFKNRSIFFLLIFALEIIGASLAFDISLLSVSSSPILNLIAKTGEWMKLVMAIAGFFLILAIPKFSSFISILKQYKHYPYWKHWLLSHFLSTAIFVYLTYYLLSIVSIDASSLTINSIALLWIVSGVSSLILLLIAIAPLACWVRLINQSPLLIVTSIIAGFLSWSLGELVEKSSEPLAEYTFHLSHLLLSFLYSDITFNITERILGARGFKVHISPQCGGYEGIGVIIAFLTTYLWLFRKDLRFPRVLLLFPLGVISIWLLNTIRIVVLIAIGSSFSPDIAIGGFHSNAGWFSFIICTVGLVLLSQKIDYFNVPQTSTLKTPPVASEITALISPFIALLSIILLTTTFTIGFDWLYPLRVIVIALLLWSFRNRYKLIFKDVTYSSIAIGIAIFIIWLLLVETSAEKNNSFIAEFFNASPLVIVSWLSFRFIGAAITVPIVEELVFRGYLIKKLVTRDFLSLKPIHFTWFSFLCSSFLFGLLHGEWIAGTIAGMGFACALYQRGEVSDAIVAHMTTNTLLAIFVLLTGNFSLW